jgi:hypothetical protein
MKPASTIDERLRLLKAKLRAKNLIGFLYVPEQPRRRSVRQNRSKPAAR